MCVIENAQDRFMVGLRPKMPRGTSLLSLPPPLSLTELPNRIYLRGADVGFTHVDSKKIPHALHVHVPDKTVVPSRAELRSLKTCNL